MNNYVQFLEEHLGKIQYGWSTDDKGESLPFQVVKYSGGPFSGTVTYSTLGLSNQPLRSPVSNKEIRQEIFLVTYSSFGDKNIPSILQYVGLNALRNKQAILRGDLFGPYGELFEASSLEALYVTIPVYFPDSFQTFISDGSSFVQSWLVPITREESDYIKKFGWDAFESELEVSDPDLVDFGRKSIF
ncbi:suppressor of fused domain protein [Tumebacillus avium]|nr:suppressor of fused domain protein [Tumebacillus avium]